MRREAHIGELPTKTEEFTFTPDGREILKRDNVNERTVPVNDTYPNVWEIFSSSSLNSNLGELCSRLCLPWQCTPDATAHTPGYISQRHCETNVSVMQTDQAENVLEPKDIHVSFNGIPRCLVQESMLDSTTLSVSGSG